MSRNYRYEIWKSDVLKTSEFARGPGLWKFNNTLLEDENYKELIEFYYPQILVKYHEVS